MDIVIIIGCLFVILFILWNFNEMLYSQHRKIIELKDTLRIHKMMIERLQRGEKW